MLLSHAKTKGRERQSRVVYSASRSPKDGRRHINLKKEKRMKKIRSYNPNPPSPEKARQSDTSRWSGMVHFRLKRSRGRFPAPQRGHER